MRGREKQPKTILIKNPRWRTRPITHARGCHIIISVEAKKKGGNIRSKLFVFICMMIDAPSNVSSSSCCPGMNYGNEMHIYDPLLLFFFASSGSSCKKKVGFRPLISFYSFHFSGGDAICWPLCNLKPFAVQRLVGSSFTKKTLNRSRWQLSKDRQMNYTNL